jgi:hypothetical protein
VDIGTITEIKKEDSRLVCRVDFGADDDCTAVLYGLSSKNEYPMIDDEVVVNRTPAENIIVAVFRPLPDGVSSGESITYARDDSGAIVSSVHLKNNGDADVVATGKINLNAEEIVLNGGTDDAVKAGALSDWLSGSLSVSTAFGPSGPALAPLTPNEKNTTVKL